MKTIMQSFPISEEEYKDLHAKYNLLCFYAANQLSRNNTKNNHQNDIEDFQQDLLIAAIRAGSYYKRQVYIEKSLVACKNYIADPFTGLMLDSLQDLWGNRTRHGAGRQKFGKYQEKILRQIMRGTVPKSQRPSRKQRLKIDSKFSTYAKHIIWNAKRSMGKKITREKPIRAGQVSLSEFGHMGSNL